VEGRGRRTSRFNAVEWGRTRPGRFILAGGMALAFSIGAILMIIDMSPSDRGNAWLTFLGTVIAAASALLILLWFFPRARPRKDEAPMSSKARAGIVAWGAGIALILAQVVGTRGQSALLGIGAGFFFCWAVVPERLLFRRTS
jgi:hypothetical protein